MTMRVVTVFVDVNPTHNNESRLLQHNFPCCPYSVTMIYHIIILHTIIRYTLTWMKRLEHDLTMQIKMKLLIQTLYE